METTFMLRQNVALYTLILHGAEGFFAGSKSVGRSEWQAYVDSLDLQDKYKGILVLQYIEVVKEEDKEKFVESVRSDMSFSPEDFASFNIHPDDKMGGEDEYFVVKYVAPYANNEAMLGFNAGYEPVWHEAFQRARDSGNEEFTSKINIGTGRGKDIDGILIALAIFSNDMPKTTPEEREKAIRGYVGINICTEDLLLGFFNETNAHPGLGLEIYDGDVLNGLRNEETLLYRNFDVRDPKIASNPYRFTESSIFKNRAHIWTLVYHASHDYGSDDVEKWLPLIVFLFGAAVSFALSGVSFFLVRARLVAMDLAHSTAKNLLETEKRFESLFNDAPDMICVLTPEGIILNVNKAVERITGYLPQEIIGKHFGELDIVTQESLIAAKEEFGKVASGDQRPAHEVNIRRKDGSPGVLEVHEHLIRHEDRDAEMLVILRDVTDRQRHIDDMRLRDSALQAASNGIVLADRTGQIVWVNKAFSVLAGYTAEEAIGKNTRILKSGQHGSEFYKNMWKTVLSGQTWHGEIINRRKDGSLYTEDMAITPVRGENGAITHFIAVKQDITERKKAERTLQKSEETNRLLLDTANDALIQADAEGVIRMWNRQAEILLGWRKEEVVDQQKIDIFLVKKDRELHHTEINNFIQTGHGSIFNQHFEMDAVHRNGHEIQVDIVIWPFQIDGQWRFNGLLHGIGEKKKLEQQMIQAQKMETVGQLAGGIAHDFNNLLTVINGYTGMRLSMTAPDDPAKADLEEIAKAGERATSLVQQLLVFSRKQVSQMKVINLNNLAQDMGKMLKRLTPESVTLIMVETPDLWSVNIDPSSFHQVITNLVVNASHAMPKGGKIAIETKNIVLGLDYVKTHQDVKPGEYVVLEVSDTGTGMTEEVKTHIFEPFFTTKEKGKGTGLGLSTVFGIVKQSNGSIEVYSEIGHGTTFKIYLPRAHEEAQAWYPSESKESLPRGNETILVVEDEESVRNFSVRILRDLGYKVLEASNGQEAQHLAEGYRPNPIHLLITDMVMPQMGGKELSEKFKSLYPKSRIIFTSGYTENIQIHSGDLRQEEAFLPKPFSQKAIAYKIREVLDR